jgi:YD repeat-containing protein
LAANAQQAVLQEPDCTNALTDNPTWTSVPTYGNVDRFNRATSSRWTNTSAVDYYRVDLTYDRNSNITSADDTILTAGTNSIPGWDVKYTMDDLNRLVQAEEGTLSSGSISSRSRDELWKQSGGSAGLSPTGSWLNHRPSRNRNLDGNGAFSFPRVSVRRSHDGPAPRGYNPSLLWSESQPTTSVSPVYSQTHDAAGRQTDDGRDYTYKFDGFGRLKEVTVNRLPSSTLDHAPDGWCLS